MTIHVSTDQSLMTDEEAIGKFKPKLLRSFSV
jgi:hypothetical protein